MKIDIIQELIYSIQISTKNSNHDHNKILARFTKYEINDVRQIIFLLLELCCKYQLANCSSS